LQRNLTILFQIDFWCDSILAPCRDGDLEEIIAIAITDAS
jgi:hypothetical protein